MVPKIKLKNTNIQTKQKQKNKNKIQQHFNNVAKEIIKEK